MASAYVGIALLARKPWALATLVPTVALIDRGVIAREERYLTRRFGDEYRAYKARVRRWL
jgi:protein-S-isoprenylcysteine O-methyltransferase Ste14